MLKIMRDELLGIGADFVFRKVVILNDNLLSANHYLSASWAEDSKEADLEGVLEALKGGIKVQVPSALLDNALGYIAKNYAPRVRFETRDIDRPFVKFNIDENELEVRALDHATVLKYLRLDFDDLQQKFFRALQVTSEAREYRDEPDDE